MATDIDRQYPGQNAGESLVGSLNCTFGFVGLEIIHPAGSPVVRKTIASEIAGKHGLLPRAGPIEWLEGLSDGNV